MSEGKVKKGSGAIEKIYQKKTPLEHILLRPDTYIGSVECVEQEMWIWDMNEEKMVKKNIKYVPGLFKIFDEIIVNAADNKQRDPNMTIIKVTIDRDENMIKIYNNGKGIPVVEHKDEKILVPTLIFGHLLTSSNYDDDEKKVTGGRNGYGAKLCNIFSKKFIVETSCHEYRKYFKQIWTNNMNEENKATIKECKTENDYTSITFYPDLSKFKMDKLDDDHVGLFARRAYDVAASTRGVKVYLNDKRLPINKFEDYCKLYIKANDDSADNVDMAASNSMKLIYDHPNPRWEVALYFSDIGFQQISFVNSIATTKGGRHVDYVCEQILKYLCEVINKKNKNGIQVKPFQIKSNLWLFVNCLIENPTFDSQTKETLTLQVKSFGSRCQLSEEFFKKVAKSPIIDRILNWLAFKERSVLENSGAKSKQSKIKGISKLDDANLAGTKESQSCTLILTEGDSAKTLAVAGLGVIGRDRYGVFPLRGKLLNAREATFKQIFDNQEISNLCKIIGLNFKEKYDTRESLKQLRYGKIMIMTDQDHDGSHIKGLIINFIHNQWPNLLKYNFIEQFITPIVKVYNNGEKKELCFYSIPEFEEWQKKTNNWQTWKIKYYKGLGTSTSKEAKQYFSDMNRHRILFDYKGIRDDLAIQLAFSKRYIEERKDWLTKYMSERSTNQSYLYKKNTKSVNYTDFINKELVLFSNLDNERSIPSLVDGLKPGQRKVLFTCFKRNLQKEIKVAQLAGSVAELSSYHHGEQSLMSTIINLAQNYVGSNNINLLMPIGQFGTRLHGGKDAASPRYIFTCLNRLTRFIYHTNDDPLFDYINDDGTYVEPIYYCPIIPMVLVNGAEGIGTGWSTKIPNYSPRELINELKHLLLSDDPNNEKIQLKPFYKHFRGQIKPVDESKVVVSGVISKLDSCTFEISELPIGVWTQVYKETVLEAYLYGTSSEKEKGSGASGKPLISDFKEYHTDSTVRFVVKMTKEQHDNACKQSGSNLYKFFKLQKAISLNSMVLFDHKGCLRRYNSVADILKEFYQVRLDYYLKRKQYLEDLLGAELAKLSNIARFILEKIDGKINIENLKKVDVIQLLSSKNYASDPIRKWKEKLVKTKGYIYDDKLTASGNKQAVEEEESDDETLNYDYLLSMPLWNLTYEKKDEIIKQQKTKEAELKQLKTKTAKQLWLDDLNQFEKELDKYEKKETEDLNIKYTSNKTNKNEYLPSSKAEFIEPVVEIAPSSSTSALNKSQTKAKTEKNEQNNADTSTTNVIDIDVEMSNETGNKNENEELKINIVDIIHGKYVNKNGEKVVLSDDEIDKYAHELIKNKKEPVKRSAVPKIATPRKSKKTDADTTIDITVNEGDESKLNKSTNESGKKPRAKRDTSESGGNKSKKKAKTNDDSDSEASTSGSDVSFNVSADNVSRRESGRARKQIKYNLDDDNAESDENDLVVKASETSKIENDSEVDEKKETDKLQSKSYLDSSDDEEDEKNKKVNATSTPLKKPSENGSNNDEKATNGNKSTTPKKTTAARKVPAKSATTNTAYSNETVDNSSDDDDKSSVASIEGEEVGKRESTGRAAKKPVKYNIDDDKDDVISDKESVNTSNSKTTPKKTPTKPETKKPTARKAPAKAVEETQKSINDTSEKPTVQKRSRAAASKSKETVVVPSDDDDDEILPVNKEEVGKRESRGRSKNPIKYNFDDEGDDTNEDEIVKTVSKPAAKKTTPARKPPAKKTPEKASNKKNDDDDDDIVVEKELKGTTSKKPTARKSATKKDEDDVIIEEKKSTSNSRARNQSVKKSLLKEEDSESDAYSFPSDDNDDDYNEGNKSKAQKRKSDTTKKTPSKKTKTNNKSDDDFSID